MKKVLTITIEEKLIEAVKDEANRQNRTVSNYIETLLIDELYST